MSTRSLAIALFLLLSVPVGMVACSGKTVDQSDPGSLLKDAEDEISSDHYQVAIDKLKEIKNKYPYSKFAVDAQIRIADVYYLQESYPEAALAYESFRDLHPKHEKTGYAMFRIAKSYFNDLPSTVARDLTPASKALDAYTAFLLRFPTAPEAEEARKDLVQVRNTLAEKEVYIGDFYFKRAFYESAKPRYEKAIALFPETAAAKAAKDQLDKIADLTGKTGEK